MRKTALAAFLCCTILAAGPSVALHAGQATITPPQQERPVRGAPHGPTLWLLLVDMALNCSGRNDAALSPMCYDPHMPGRINTQPSKLQ